MLKGTFRAVRIPSGIFQIYLHHLGCGDDDRLHAAAEILLGHAPTNAFFGLVGMP